MSVEEELDIASVGTTIPSASASGATKQAESTVDFHSKIPDLANTIAPGATAAEILDALISQPSSSLYPSEVCELPSRGLYYGWPDGMIYVRPMGLDIEKAMASARLGKTGQALDILLTTCCRFPNGFEVDDLLVGDRTFILYYIRGITHGEKYEFAATCPNAECNKVSIYSYNLMSLLSTVTVADPAWGPEPFKVSLPYLSKAYKRDIWAGVRLLRARDVSQINLRAKATENLNMSKGIVRNRNATNNRQASQPNNSDELFNANIERIIVSMMGETDPLKIRQIISGGKLHSQDTAAIRDFLAKHTPGIDSAVIMTCPSCKQEATVALPITAEFFRPSK